MEDFLGSNLNIVEYKSVIFIINLLTSPRSNLNIVEYK